ncbi:MAG: HAMP domain-containing histidine kinase [Oscillospiraceae bacterium]|nr:HAMP domain-containing histidine kinase [Oscillospiraceae bacterium]
MTRRPFRLRLGSRLFRKYFASIAAILSISFVFLVSAFLVFSARYWAQDKQRLLAENTANVASAVEMTYRQSGHVNGAPVVRNLLRSTSLTLEADFFLCDARGEVVGCPDSVPNTTLPSRVNCDRHDTLIFPPAVVRRAMAEAFTDSGTLQGVFPEQMFLSAHPLSEEGQVVGFVLAAQPVNPGIVTYLGGITRIFLLSGLWVLALTFLVIYYITYRLVRPLHDMARATREFSQGDFSRRVIVRENDELGTLAKAFNSMAISLATLESTRRSFVANVSHELKTPMTTIGGFIDGMRDGTIPPERHKYYLDLVSGEVQRLSRLVTGMLNLSKIEDGELSLNPVPFDISELLFQTILSFEQLIAKKHIEIAGLESLEPTELTGDKDMLHQVFYNLIDNAVKFTPEGGRIEFYVQIHQPRPADRPDARSKEQIFCFGLRNTGVGISSEELGRVFERFYKADRSRSYDVKGAGLGLYLVKTIVELHGGQIKADSDGASYVEFAVLLPIKAGE